nr:hypothetical protein DOP62_02690 [Synechococcus elongatus PCC 11801]
MPLCRCAIVTLDPTPAFSTDPELICFSSRFQDEMEMYAPAEVVAHYLDRHEEWFRRCAEPMTTTSIGKDAYAIVLGRYGSLGFEVEPQIGLELLPADQGVYRICTVPVPGYEPQGYQVDFQASLSLEQLTHETDAPVTEATAVAWDLLLTVGIRLPRFIHMLPQKLVHSTGDHLLRQIVRQTSRRLTHRVQEDFHQQLNLPLPPRRHARF